MPQETASWVEDLDIRVDGGGISGTWTLAHVGPNPPDYTESTSATIGTGSVSGLAAAGAARLTIQYHSGHGAGTSSDYVPRVDNGRLILAFTRADGSIDEEAYRRVR